MAIPNSRATLIKYCKRALGAPVVEINVDDDQVDDRIDEALQFYQDSSLWWVIAIANNSKTDSLAVQQGVQLRIPANPGDILSLYEEFNENR